MTRHIALGSMDLHMLCSLHAVIGPGLEAYAMMRAISMPLGASCRSLTTVQLAVLVEDGLHCCAGRLWVHVGPLPFLLGAFLMI